MYSFLFPTALNQIGDRPRASFDASGLSGRHAQCAMRFAEVVISKIERNRSLKVFQLFAESSRQSAAILDL